MRQQHSNIYFSFAEHANTFWYTLTSMSTKTTSDARGKFVLFSSSLSAVQAQTHCGGYSNRIRLFFFVSSHFFILFGQNWGVVSYVLCRHNLSMCAGTHTHTQDTVFTGIHFARARHRSDINRKACKGAQSACTQHSTNENMFFSTERKITTKTNTMDSLIDENERLTNINSSNNNSKNGTNKK